MSKVRLAEAFIECPKIQSAYLDSRQIPTAQVFESDLCVVGAGAAGITIAREFIGSDAKVLLLESGGLDLDEEIEALNVLSVTGHSYAKEGSRLRFFGGTTNHWGGHCAPMRPDVFERRDWIPYSGWPFGIEELHPYYERAHEIIEIGPYEYRPAPVAERLGLKLLPFDPRSVETVLSRYHRQNSASGIVATWMRQEIYLSYSMQRSLRSISMKTNDTSTRWRSRLLRVTTSR